MTISVNEKQILWCEKYRPQKVEECILPPRIKDNFADIVKSGQIPNLLLYGGAGVGKTTIAKAMCMEMGVDWLLINMSEDSGIDTLRTKIRDFASKRSITTSGRKCVILDEFDYATPNLQAGLRGFIEQYSANCAFVMTCNYPNRIMDAIASRTTSVDFSATSDEAARMQAEFFVRCTQILKNEDIKYDEEVLAKIVSTMYPDNRRILNVLDAYSRGGVIDVGILNNLTEVSIESLIGYMKTKNFKEVRQWCAENAKNDLTNTYTLMYRELKNHIANDSIPEAILILEEYQRFNSTVPDKEIHICAMCVQMLINLEFK